MLEAFSNWWQRLFTRKPTVSKPFVTLEMLEEPWVKAERERIMNRHHELDQQMRERGQPGPYFAPERRRQSSVPTMTGACATCGADCLLGYTYCIRCCKLSYAREQFEATSDPGPAVVWPAPPNVGTAYCDSTPEE